MQLQRYCFEKPNIPHSAHQSRIALFRGWEDIHRFSTFQKPALEKRPRFCFWYKIKPTMSYYSRPTGLSRC